PRGDSLKRSDATDRICLRRFDCQVNGASRVRRWLRSLFSREPIRGNISLWTEIASSWGGIPTAISSFRARPSAGRTPTSLASTLEITTKLSTTLELDTLLPKITDSLFQIFKQADRVFIIMRGEANQPLIPKVIKTRRPTDEGNARFSRRVVNQCLENVQAL